MLGSVKDGYIVGAVPPYNQLFGGKLVASLIGSREVCTAFDERYGDAVDIISAERKRPRLALVTVTSALGKSSIYNRMRLPGLVELVRIGQTAGWGHFHVPDQMFREMRNLLDFDGHKYANGHQYGDGPNWRLRVIRQSLKAVGMDRNLLRHGIGREVYAMPSACNWLPYLQAQDFECV